METPRSEQFDDIYFAVENGLAESKYVFLEQNGLPAGWDGRDRFTICETGFGTGLNFLNAWTLFEKTARSGAQLTYISFEKYPLSKDEILKYLGHWSGEFGGRLEQLAVLYPLRVGGWHKIRVSDRVTLLLIFDDVNRALPQLDFGVDCWFLDGHAPAKNPEMWSEFVFSNMGRLSRAGARVATFTAAGFVRRGLESVGFQVSKAKGYGRKRDMSVGVFAGAGKQDDLRPIPSRVAVIGGGIAGTSITDSLKTRGIEVDLYEKTGLASGGSGNVRGLFNPRLTAQQGNESDFYSAAFALAVRAFEKLQSSYDIGYVRCGSLHLSTDETKEKRFTGFLNSWGWYKDHAYPVTREQAEDLSGVPVKYGGLYLSDAGVVSPFKVVEILAENVNVVAKEITSLDPLRGNYDAVVLAGAADVAKFSQTSDLPVSTVRGQVSLIETPDVFLKLKSNLCYGGYASLPFDGKMVVGSTFQPWLDDLALREEDHADVLRKLFDVVDGFDGGSVIGGRAAFRCASKDRVPLIGEVEENLYISTAHGSHGLITSLLGAEVIAAQVTGEVCPVPQNVSRYFSPIRFKSLPENRRTSFR